MLIRLFVLLTIILLPLFVISLGYAPVDDLLRDVAKAVSGKSWGDVMLLRPDLNPELRTHPGWDALLQVLSGIGINKDYLLIIAVVGMSFLAFLPGAIFLRRAEALVFVLILAVIFDFPVIERYFFGRPYLLGVACMASCFYLWNSFEKNYTNKKLIALMLLLIAIRVWIRSTVIMLGIPLLAVYVSACIKHRWRPATIFTGCILAGIILGTMMTGAPIEFITYNFKHFHQTLFREDSVRIVVKELEPLLYFSKMFLFFLAYLVWRIIYGRGTKGFAHPAFILACVGWGLGFYIARFWFEYGFPSMCIWLTLDLQDELEKKQHATSRLRLLTTTLSCILLVLVLILPHKTKWMHNPISRDIAVKRLYMEDPSWFPDDNGLIYSASMQVFFTFYHMFPHAPWRYVTGMEAGFMRKEDLAVYEEIHITGNADAYLPWINKMTPDDRFVLVLASDAQVVTGFPMLEWRFVAPEYWFGRLRRNVGYRRSDRDHKTDNLSVNK